MTKCLGFGQAWIDNPEEGDDCIKCKKTKIDYWKECKKKTNQLVKDYGLTDEEIEEYIRKKKENK